MVPVLGPEGGHWGCVLAICECCLVISSGRFLGCGVRGWFPPRLLLRGPEWELVRVLVDCEGGRVEEEAKDESDSVSSSLEE